MRRTSAQDAHSNEIASPIRRSPLLVRRRARCAAEQQLALQLRLDFELLEDGRAERFAVQEMT